MDPMLGYLLTFLVISNGALYEDQVADRLIRKASDATYHLRLNEARTAATELQQRYPEHPAGFLIMAETYWWEAQTDPHNEKIESAYYRAQEMAQEKAEFAVKAGRYYKPEALAYLASAHGSYARFEVTQKESFYRAMRAGLRAHRYAKEAYELDPDYYDVYVGLGAFNYFSGTLPSVIKPFAWLFGASGDKDLGVRQLETAIQKARYSVTEARIVYYSALLANKEYGAAFPMLERLMTDYPDNFVLYDWASEWFLEQDKREEGCQYFERLHSRQTDRPLLAQHALLEKANLQLAQDRKAEALETLKRIKGMGGSDPLVATKVQALEIEARKK